jgi:S-adenosylmethionine:tRNA ribosyltransferase-isomerase
MSDRFDYTLPSNAINQFPYENPEDSKLLNANTREIFSFSDLPELVQTNSLFILNKSKVKKVRILTSKLTGGKLEIFILKIIDDYTAVCLIKSSDRKNIDKLYKTTNFNFRILQKDEDSFTCKFDVNVNDLIKEYGILPLPPYIKDDPEKRKKYNNEFSDDGFSVASPTAGLHFSNKLINKLAQTNDFAFVNLDVNIDTFKPMKSSNLDEHNIHSETYSITSDDFNKIIDFKNNGKPIYCVGTTSLRAIETAYTTNNLSGTTDLFIKPDTKINIPNFLITNFHAPMSSLLSIVENVYGEGWKELYEYALNNKLKFLSFGDAVLFEYK